jgi:hypothetical protein
MCGSVQPALHFILASPWSKNVNTYKKIGMMRGPGPWIDPLDTSVHVLWPIYLLLLTTDSDLTMREGVQRTQFRYMIICIGTPGHWLHFMLDIFESIGSYCVDQGWRQPYIDSQSSGTRFPTTIT